MKNNNKITRGHWPIHYGGSQKLQLQEFGIQSDPKIGSMRPQFSKPLELGRVGLKNNIYTTIQILH